jgi:hypothetical protein
MYFDIIKINDNKTKKVNEIWFTKKYGNSCGILLLNYFKN